MAYPVCTDMAVSGAAHFKRKRERDPLFQRKAANYAIWCAELFQAIGCPYFIENPVSVLSTLWRKPDYSFHPYEYGGYIDPEQAEHPRWPEYIAPMDAYPKKTCLWTGGDFTMPVPSPVYPEKGHSRQHLKLGGKSMKTKTYAVRHLVASLRRCSTLTIQRCKIWCDNLSTIQNRNVAVMLNHTNREEI